MKVFRSRCYGGFLNVDFKENMRTLGGSAIDMSMS